MGAQSSGDEDNDWLEEWPETPTDYEDEASTAPSSDSDPSEEDYTKAYALGSQSSEKPAVDLESWGAEENELLAGEDSCDCGCDLPDCDLSGRGCASYCMPYGLSAAVEATYLKPRIENSNQGLDPTDSFGYQAAPRIWVQWQNRVGWGIRGRYWDYHNQQQLSGISDSSGTSVGAQNFNDRLQVYAIDLELTRSFRMGLWDCCASVGARHGRLWRNQSLQLTVFDLAGGGGDDATVIQQDVNRGIDGTGITMAFGLRRPFLNSRLAAICNLRGSVLWGGNDLNQTFSLIEVVPVGAGNLDLNDFQTLSSSDSNNKAMWIGEIQAGGEWNTPISRAVGAGNAFVRVMFEAQFWNLPGVTSTGQGFSTSTQLYEFIGVTAAIGYAR